MSRRIVVFMGTAPAFRTFVMERVDGLRDMAAEAGLDSTLTGMGAGAAPRFKCPDGDVDVMFIRPAVHGALRGLSGSVELVVSPTYPTDTRHARLLDEVRRDIAIIEATQPRTDG